MKRKGDNLGKIDHELLEQHIKDDEAFKKKMHAEVVEICLAHPVPESFI